jgi:hemerythrin-like domain-containing protein
MLTNLIKKRFFKHHDHLLAFLDTLEEPALKIESSEDPLEEFLKKRQIIGEFFSFMEVQETQHEKEEEKILLPAIEKRLESDREKLPRITADHLHREHSRGLELVSDLKQLYLDLEEKRPVDKTPYLIFSKGLHELIWHYRRHVQEENSLVLPEADELYPEK